MLVHASLAGAQLSEGCTGRVSCSPWSVGRPLAGTSIAWRRAWPDSASRQGGGRRGGERRALRDPISLLIVDHKMRVHLAVYIHVEATCLLGGYNFDK